MRYYLDVLISWNDKIVSWIDNLMSCYFEILSWNDDLISWNNEIVFWKLDNEILSWNNEIQSHSDFFVLHSVQGFRTKICTYSKTTDFLLRYCWSVSGGFFLSLSRVYVCVCVCVCVWGRGLVSLGHSVPYATRLK